MLKNYLAEKAPETIPYLAVIHRLDQPVEGLLVFAKNQKAAADLNRQMTSGKIKKEYLAVTEKKPLKDRGQLTDYLKKTAEATPLRWCKRERPGRKRHGCFMRCWKPVRTLLNIHLETGRHHQIRVQMASCPNAASGGQKIWSIKIFQKACTLFSRTFLLPSGDRKTDDLLYLPGGRGLSGICLSEKSSPYNFGKNNHTKTKSMVMRFAYGMETTSDNGWDCRGVYVGYAYLLPAAVPFLAAWILAVWLHPAVAAMHRKIRIKKDWLRRFFCFSSSVRQVQFFLGRRRIVFAAWDSL